jgi:hypothetical protein
MTTKLDDARAEIAELVLDARIPGLGHSRRTLTSSDEYRASVISDAQENAYGGSHFEWEQSWGVSCTLRINWKEAKKRTGGKTVTFSVPSCDIGWSSTGRDIVSARAAILLYSAVTDLATLIQTHYRDRYIESESDYYKRLEAIERAEEDLVIEEFKKTLGNGDTFTYDEVGNGVPRRVEASLCDCNATKSRKSSDVCGVDTKTLTWDANNSIFMARCGRHKHVGLTIPFDLPKNKEAA